MNQPIEESDDREITLVVDLDGTLCKTDTLHEALLRMIAESPLTLFSLPAWICRGRAELKARLADQWLVPAENLPLNEAVLKRVRTARQSGRRTALVSAADHRQVTAVAHATGIFVEAYGSAEGHNLKSVAKADFLNERFGPGNFDYMGDSWADLPVWKASRKAITVGAGKALRDAVSKTNRDFEHMAPVKGRTKATLKTVGPQCWKTSAWFFVPAFANLDFSDFFSIALGAVVFCLASSATCIVNDLLNLRVDRGLPRKKERAFAAGELSAAYGMSLAMAFLISAGFLAMLVGKPAFVMLSVFLCASLTYSLSLKKTLMIDIVALSCLSTILVGAGSAVAGLHFSPWLASFAFFLSLGIEAVKVLMETVGQGNPNRSSLIGNYEICDLPVLRGIGITASHASCLILALYVSSESVAGVYSRPGLLWLICVLVLTWMLRLLFMAHRGAITNDVLDFALSDKGSRVVILLGLCVWVLAVL